MKKVKAVIQEVEDMANHQKIAIENMMINATKAKMKDLNKNTELCEQKDIELMCKDYDFRADTNNMLRKQSTQLLK